MWRLGTLLVLLAIVCCSSSAGHENSQRVRLRRSPHYPCPPYFYDSHPHPRHFPPPPPFWPPPPPPPQQYYQERQNFDNDLQPQNFNQHSQAYSDAGPPANPPNQGEVVIFPENKPCDKCNKGQDTAISNAKSVSGSAVAVAISGKGNNAAGPS